MAATSLRVGLDELGTSTFARQVFEDARQTDRDAFEQGRAADLEAMPKREISEAEFHRLACGFALAHLLGLFDQLVLVPAYLSRYTRTPQLAAGGGTRAADLRYHIEGFLIRATMLEERILQLFSAVCHTGLALTAVNRRAIASNSKVTSPGLEKHLRSFQSLCSPYIQLRNQVVHQHGYLDADLRLIEGVLLGSRILPIPKRHAAASHYRWLVKELARTKEVEVREFVAKGIELSTSAFEDLHVQYKRRQNQLAVSDS